MRTDLAEKNYFLYESEVVDIMKVTIFGGTGITGAFLINEALKRGIGITVYARNSSSFNNPNVRIIKGDLSDKELLREAIQGADAVVSALGPSKPNHPKGLPITKAYKDIISVMEQVEVNRIIAISTMTAADPEDVSNFKNRFPALMVKVIAPSVYNDIVETAKIIRNSALDWTIVRVPFLNNKPASKKLNVGLYGHTKHSQFLSREDVAIFMLDQISEHKYICQAPGISANRKTVK
jgi:putative NADH-flavin reductase